jgi:intergrase/recombinase
VKSAFNKLIERIKEGEFEIELEEVGEDLFSQVANEYIMQLNREIGEVRDEMIQYGLIEEEDEDLF